MDTSLESIFSFVRLSTGRRLSIYNQLRPLVEARQLPDLVAHIDRASTHDRYTQDLENQWAARPERASYAREVARLDAVVDTTLTSIRDIARAQTAGLPDDDPIVAANERLQEEAFPAGVFAITSLRFVDEIAAVEAVVQRLAGLTAEVALLGLTARVARLVQLAAAYRAAVDAYPEALEYATVRAGQRRGQSLLLEITARIVGTFYDEESEDHQAARAELLSPVMIQLEIVRAHNRARRRAGDAADAGPEPGDGAEVAADIADIADIAADDAATPQAAV